MSEILKKKSYTNKININKNKEIYEALRDFIYKLSRVNI